MERVGSRRLRAPFVGRDDLTSTSMRFLERIRTGGVALLLTGAAGMGKTRAIEHVLGTPPVRDLPVLRTAAAELEAAVPFGVVSRLFGLRPTVTDEDAAELGMRIAETGDAIAATALLQVADGVVELLERRSADGPLVVVADDLHWADTASLRVLDRVVRGLDHLQVAVLLAARTTPRPAELAALARTVTKSDRAHLLELAPLDEAAALDLAVRLLDATPGPNLQRAITVTAGNPLYLVELLAVASGAGLLDTVDLPDDRLPPSLREIVLDHLAQLPASTIRLLRVASTLGTTFALDLLALVVDRPELDVVGDLQPALDAAVVVESGDGLAFAHDLFQEALYQDQPQSVRSAHHRAVIAALRTATAPIIDVVPHLLRADWASVPDAADLLHDAAVAMGTRSAIVAADLHERALEAAGADVDPRWQLAAITTLTAAGRTERARDVLHDVTRRPIESFDEDVRDELAGAPAPLADPLLPFDEHWALLDRMQGAGVSARGAAGVASQRALLLWRAGQRDESRLWAEQARELSQSLSDHRLLMRAELVLCRLTEGDADWTAARDHARQALEHARRTADPIALVDAAMTYALEMGNSAAHRGDAERALDEATVVATRLGSPLLQGIVDAVAGIHDVRWGAWGRAGPRLDAALDVIEQVHGLVNPSALAQVPARAARLYVHLGDLALADQRLQVARELAAASAAIGTGADELVLVDVAEVEVALAHGDVEHAMAAARALQRRARDRGVLLHEVLHASILLDAFLRGGDAAAAAEVTERAREFVGDDPPIELVRLVERVEARLVGDADRLRALVAVMDEHGIPWEYGPQVREEAAEAMVARGDHDEAIALLEEALGLWDGTGARHDVDRVRAALRDLGVQRGRGPATNRPDTGWDALTEAEWRVVRLVADGRVYREIGELLFISRRTVETHVRHVFRKLGVTSRGELSALLLTPEGRANLERLANHRPAGGP